MLKNHHKQHHKNSSHFHSGKIPPHTEMPSTLNANRLLQIHIITIIRLVSSKLLVWRTTLHLLIHSITHEECFRHCIAAINLYNPPC